MQQAAELLARAAEVLRRLIGAPAYDDYLAHMRDRHPDTPVLDADAFTRDALSRRYDRPGSRCC